MDLFLWICVAVACVVILLTIVIGLAIVFWPKRRPSVVAATAPRFVDSPRVASYTPRDKALQIVALQRELGDEAEAADWQRSAAAARLHGHRAAQQAAWTYTPAGMGGAPASTSPN